MRLGVDYFEDIFIVPVHFNYLIAKKGKFLEVGAGGTMQTGVIDFAYGTNDLKVVPTFWLGYRFQES